MLLCFSMIPYKYQNAKYFGHIQGKMKKRKHWWGGVFLHASGTSMSGKGLDSNFEYFYFEDKFVSKS